MEGVAEGDMHERAPQCDIDSNSIRKKSLESTIRSEKKCGMQMTLRN